MTLGCIEVSPSAVYRGYCQSHRPVTMLVFTPFANSAESLVGGGRQAMVVLNATSIVQPRIAPLENVAAYSAEGAVVERVSWVRASGIRGALAHETSFTCAVWEPGSQTP